MIKAYKYPIKLTDTNKSILMNWSNRCRYIWNQSLDLRERLYKKYKISISYNGKYFPNGTKDTYGLNKRLTRLRGRYDWLAEVPNCCQQEILRDLDKAYVNFFRRCKQGDQNPGYPQPKLRFEKPRLYFPKNRFTFNYVDNKIAYLKISKLGTIRVIYDRPAIEHEKDKISSISIVYDNNKWFVCILVNKFTSDEVKKDNSNKEVVGIDMGIKKTYTLSNGVIYNIDYEKIKSLQKRKSILQKRLSKKIGSKKGEKKSSKWIKLKKTIRKIDMKMGFIRENFNHQTSKEISENYKLVAIEKLKIKNMTKSAKGDADNHGKNVKQKSALNRAILERGWGQFKIFLKYKCKNNNVELIEVDPKYTSLKCNKCGNIDKKNRVSQSSFICTKCGHAENAYLHASKNILDAGIKTLADSPE